MAGPDFWDKQDLAQETIKELNRLKAAVQGIALYRSRLEDALALKDLLEEAGESPEYLEELSKLLDGLSQDIENIEISSFLSGPHDRANAILSIHAGAGGTESCDWADMLFRLYARWAERRGFKLEIQDIQDGEEAGISRVTLRIEGPNAYGYAKAERGVHRLVRISPFDSNKRRHTSFASVDVIAEIENDVELDIPEAD